MLPENDVEDWAIAMGFLARNWGGTFRVLVLVSAAQELLHKGRVKMQIIMHLIGFTSCFALMHALISMHEHKMLHKFKTSLCSHAKICADSLWQVSC